MTVAIRGKYREVTIVKSVIIAITVLTYSRMVWFSKRFIGSKRNTGMLRTAPI